MGSGTLEENKAVNSTLEIPLSVKSSCEYLDTRISLQHRGSGYQMGHRTAKAGSMLSKMKYKGISTVGISNRAAVKILYATIVPSLVYGMESFYLTKSQYEQLDTFVADALRINPTVEDRDKPVWNLFETDMVPSSVLVKIVKVKLGHKTCNLPEEHLLSKLHSGKGTRIVQEIKAIMKEWCSVEGLQETVSKNKKSTMKLHLKELKQDLIEKSYMNSIKGSYLIELPQQLAKLQYDTKSLLLRQRKKSMVLSIEKGMCLVCHTGQMVNEKHTHQYLECHNLPRQLREKNIWTQLDTYDTELTEHLQGLSKPDLMMYLLGYQQFGNKVMSLVVLQTAHAFFEQFTLVL